MACPGDDDDVLLERFVGGEVEAFGVFYERHLPAMLGFFLRRIGDRELAADLSAEVFAAAVLSAEHYRPGESPAVAWLYAIAAHKLIDSRRRGRVEDAARRRLALDALALEDDDLRRVEDLAEVEAIEPQLREALGTLPVHERDAVLARVVDERGYREIAARMRCSEMVVRKRVSRGLQALRSELKEAP